MRSIDLLSLEVTSHCNFSCTFCPDGLMERPRGHMDVALFEKVCAELEAKRDRIPVRQVQLNLMGEPFLNPKLFEMIKAANRHGIRPVAVTNGSLLTDERARKLFEVELEYLQLSYQTPTPELYKLREAKKGTFDEYRARCLNFLEARFAAGSNLPVHVHMLDNSEGYLKGFRMVEGELRQEQQRFFEDWARTIQARYGVPAGAGALDPDTTELLPGVRLLFRDCMDWGHAIRPEGIGIVPNERGTCPLPGFQLAVLWNGDVTICCLDYEGKTNVGNVKTQSFEEVWNSPRLKHIQDEMMAGRLVEKLCQDCRGTLIELKTGRVVPNSDRPLWDRAREYVRSYGLKAAFLRAWIEVGHRFRRGTAPEPKR